MRQRLSAKVASPKDSRTDTEKYCENPHHRDNVNVAQGPRTGNTGAHEAKRGNFKAAKAEREPLAAAVMKAFGERQLHDYEDHDFPNEGQIDPNSGVKRFAKRKAR